ncbi:hypothetical protein JCM11251_006314 [Rhodosporidiobolus azoricus]
MLTTIELISSLLGYWAMGTGIQLFLPEYVAFFKGHVGKKNGKPKPPAESDFAQLIALLVVGSFVITQVALYVIVAVLESLFLILLLIYAGYCCCMRQHRSTNRAKVLKEKQNRSAVHAGLRAMQSGTIHPLPPGGEDLHGLYNKKVQKEKEIEEEKKAMKMKSSWKWLFIQLVIVIAIFTGVWAAVDFARRETATPAHVSKRPESTAEVASWYVAWFGAACWIAPRALNIGRSIYYKRPEQVTTQGVLIGGLTHLFNIGSIVSINNHGDALYAQLPFICTSAGCVGADVIRLTLKFVYLKGQPLPPWTSFFGLFGNGPTYDPFHKAKEEKPRKRDMLKGRRRDRTPAASSSELESGGQFSSDHDSSSGTEKMSSRRRKHVKDLQQAALLPFLPVPKHPSDDDSDDHFGHHRVLAQDVNRKYVSKYNKPREQLAALHRAHNEEKAAQLDGERELAEHARQPYEASSDDDWRGRHHDLLRGALDHQEARRQRNDQQRRREARQIIEGAGPEQRDALHRFDQEHLASSDDDSDAQELRRLQDDPRRRLPLDHWQHRLSSGPALDLGFPSSQIAADKKRAEHKA